MRCHCRQCGGITCTDDAVEHFYRRYGVGWPSPIAMSVHLDRGEPRAYEPYLDGVPDEPWVLHAACGLYVFDIRPAAGVTLTEGHVAKMDHVAPEPPRPRTRPGPRRSARLAVRT